MRWYVVEANAKSEHLAAREIKALGLVIYLPEYLQRIRHARKSALVRRALFSGYLFAQFDKDTDPQWPRIFSRRGVIGMICDAANQPKPVPDAQMDAVRKIADGFDDVVCEAVPLVLGQFVKIIEGAFAAFPAVITRADESSTITVETTIFGKATPVILPRDHVAPVTR